MYSLVEILFRFYQDEQLTCDEYTFLTRVSMNKEKRKENNKQLKLAIKQKVHYRLDFIDIAKILKIKRNSS